jgi:hypothetical protein
MYSLWIDLWAESKDLLLDKSKIAFIVLLRQE